MNGAFLSKVFKLECHYIFFSFQLRCDPDAQDLSLVRLHTWERTTVHKPSTHHSYSFLFMACTALEFSLIVLSYQLCATCYILGAQDSRDGNYYYYYFCDRYEKYWCYSLTTVPILWRLCVGLFYGRFQLACWCCMCCHISSFEFYPNHEILSAG